MTSPMPIVGHGIDIVETARIAKMLQEHGQRFLDRCFTPPEQLYCARNGQGSGAEGSGDRVARQDRLD
jgi:phosphopantetheinyl transferase (holo-ACP synthase)